MCRSAGTRRAARHAGFDRISTVSQSFVHISVHLWAVPATEAHDSPSAASACPVSIDTQYGGVPLWKRRPSTSGPASMPSNPNSSRSAVTAFFASASSPASGSDRRSGDPTGLRARRTNEFGNPPTVTVARSDCENCLRWQRPYQAPGWTEWRPAFATSACERAIVKCHECLLISSGHQSTGIGRQPHRGPYTGSC
jgi:hypothetical protein